mmetsp:Transcript_27542/g.50754  ORF Transcript_27542/g.50754 Transcript_27542/m.50754 type:complete len:131 (-) Transcript_27542:1514-1906(-)
MPQTHHGRDHTDDHHAPSTHPQRRGCANASYDHLPSWPLTVGVYEKSSVGQLNVTSRMGSLPIDSVDFSIFVSDTLDSLASFTFAPVYVCCMFSWFWRTSSVMMRAASWCCLGKLNGRPISSRHTNALYS